jgi:hypothetical protein
MLSDFMRKVQRARVYARTHPMTHARGGLKDGNYILRSDVVAIALSINK